MIAPGTSTPGRVADWIVRRRYFVVFGLLALVFFGYLAGVRAEASVFGDGAGKWFQIKALIAQGYTNWQCDYDTNFDPGFRWLPGPWYFYHVADGICFYGYQYPYALLAAPFVQLWPDYGYYLLNFALLALFVFYAMRCAQTLFASTPHRSLAELLAGLGAFVVIPSPTFAFDLSEVTLALAIVTGSLHLTLRGTGLRFGDDRFAPAWKPLLAGGFVAGSSFALRTESAIYALCVVAALCLTFWRRPPDPAPAPMFARTRARRAARASLPFAAGCAVAWLLVAGFHLYFFGNLAGNRGTTHANLVFLEYDLARQWQIARILLLGGPLGLLSALPSIALAGLWFLFPGARRVAGPTGFFLIALALPSVALVLLTAPNDAGYSWSPRYLAFVFVPLYLLILGIILRWPPLRRWYWTLALLLIFGHAVYFTHSGMKVLQQTSRQNLNYSAALLATGQEVIVIDAAPAIGFISEELLDRKRVYMALDTKSAAALLRRLASSGVREFLYVRTPLRSPTFDVETAMSFGDPEQNFRAVRQQHVDGMSLYIMRLERARGR